MNRHKSTPIIIMFMFAVITALAWTAQAQSSFISPGDVLIYSRLLGQQGQYVRLASSFQQVYDIPQDTCSLKSTAGTYVAESPLPDNRGELIIRRLDTQATIIQTPWQATWDACYIVWSTDTVLSIRQHGTQQDYFNFDVSSGSLVPVSDPYSPPQYPPLPGWMSQSNQNFILPSPQSNIFLYERCPTGQVNAGNNCHGITDFVIYDAGQQQVLHVLQKPNGDLVRGYDPTDWRRWFSSYPGAAWSATGRYLAFQRYQKTPYDYFTLSIYDLTAAQYVNTDWINAHIDYQRAIQWSPQGNKLVFWKIGRIGEIEDNDNLDTLRTPVIFNADTTQFLLPDQPFNMDAQGGGVEFTWSPDGQSLVFVDGSGNLMDIDASSGTTTVLDTQVHEVITWKQDAATFPTTDALDGFGGGICHKMHRERQIKCVT